jgi:hypothetical protein
VIITTVLVNIECLTHKAMMNIRVVGTLIITISPPRDSKTQDVRGVLNNTVATGQGIGTSAKKALLLQLCQSKDPA